MTGPDRDRSYTLAMPETQDRPGPFTRTFTGFVDERWLDANGHMGEGHYGQVFADATDAMLVMLGFDPSLEHTATVYFTTETHTVFRDELLEDDRIAVDTFVVGVDELRLQLFHELRQIDDEPDDDGSPAEVVVATQESLLALVDADTASIAALDPDTVERIAALQAPVEASLLGRAIAGP